MIVRVICMFMVFVSFASAAIASDSRALNMMVGTLSAACALSQSGTWHIYLTATGQPETGPNAIVFKRDGSDLSVCVDGYQSRGSVSGQSISFEAAGLTFTGSIVGKGSASGVYSEQGVSAGAWRMVKQSNSLTCNPLPTWDISQNGIPRFVSFDHIELSKITRISKFRSGEGHDYSDDFEQCRSMKHYYQPFANLDWSQVQIFSPVSGTVEYIEEEWAGKQVRIVSSDYPAFTFVIFHITLDAGIVAGSQLSAGQRLGTHVGNQTWDDVAVRVRTPQGERLVSFFDVMTDELFAAYQARGAGVRDNFIIPESVRDASPLTCNGESFANAGSLQNWFQLGD